MFILGVVMSGSVGELTPTIFYGIEIFRILRKIGKRGQK